jgi:hypothetical protein
MKTKILVGLVVITVLGFISAYIFAGETTKEEIGYINIKITDTNTGKDNLSIRVPISLLELIDEFDHESKIGISNDCKIDFKKLVQLMKKSNNEFLIKIEDSEEHTVIKIWFD